MTKEELKAQHPDTYAAVLADGKAAGDKEGSERTLKNERTRVDAFLVAGENSGDMKNAIEAIRSGEEMTMAHMTKFMFAGRNKQDIETRQQESDEAGKTLDGAAAAKESPKSLLDIAASVVKSGRGEVTTNV